MKKLSLLLLLVLASISQAFSQAAIKVDEETAYNTAKAFSASHQTFKGDDLFLVSSDGIYIYNVGTHGFVIVSGNTVLPPVIAWSDQGSFPDMEDAPENFASWIAHYSEMIDFAIANGIAPEAKIQRQWDEAAQGVFGSREAQTVDPLVSTRWNQDCYYNEYCPSTGGSWGGPCGHAYAGCVACAMAQVMKYWNHPAQGFGAHSYIHSTYGEQSANFGATTYNWNQMPTQIYSHNDAVATLMYHCGVSVNMNYSPDGSGAYSSEVETAMRSYFGYCGAKYREKSAYQEEDWIALLKLDLDQSRPLYYSGNSSNSGHAFVCDGYDNSNRMHFNFGWSGSGDGYYTVNDVHGFNQYQAVVMNIYPKVILPDENGIIYVTTDGTGDGSSWENATDKLEYAITRSSDGIRVWVKQGVYYGDTLETEGAFDITDGNLLYGGFNGDEAPNYDLSQRDFVNHATILDGQGTRRVLNQSKSFNAATAAVWDGFTIRNGAIGSGAGAYLNNYVTLKNCSISDNVATMYGGGLYINSTGGASRVTLSNCTITGNSSSMGGGVCDRIGATFTNCNIINNTATTKGGGLYLYINTEPVFKNCVFGNNTAKNAGAMYARGKFTAYNCDFVMNLATESIGGVFNEAHHNKYYNCILWGNMANGLPSQVDGVSDYEYCAVQGGIEGTENITLLADNDGEGLGDFVRFNQPTEGAGADYHDADWSLQSGSICLNAGKPNTTGLGGTDIGGNPRIQKGRIEIGAYESCAALTVTEDNACDGEPYLFNGTELTEAGQYMAIFPIVDCDSVVRLTLSFMESPKVIIEGINNISMGESVTLTASGADSYLWSTGETTENILVSPTINTVYSVVGSNVNGCTDTASISITVIQGCTEAQEARYTVWPNPTQGLLHIEAESMDKVELCNLLGQVVLQAEKVETIDLSSLDKGVYFLMVSDKKGMKTVTKIIKE